VANLLRNKKQKPVPKAYLWILLAVIVIGLGLYLYQSLTPDFPDDPKEALGKITAAMKKVDTLTMKFKHEVGRDLAEPEFTVEGFAQAKLPADYKGLAEISGSEVVLEQSPVAAKFEFAYIDQVHYYRNIEEEKWQDYSEVSDFTPFLRIEPLAFLEYAEKNAVVVREKDEAIDGKDYAVFSFSFAGDKTGEILKPLALLISDIPPESTVAARIWVDPLTKLVRRQFAKVTVADLGGEQVTRDYTGYGELFSISLAADEIEKQAPPTPEELATRDDLVTRQERNEQRQIDLLAIHLALEKIYDEVNVYPESPAVTNLSDSNTEVSRQLLKYLKEIPADPQAPEYFYGYYCVGGEQYELTAVQETDDGVKIHFMTQSIVILEEKK
jgi:hypothetical protein